MPDMQVAYNPTTKIAMVQAYGDAPPSGSTVEGSWTATATRTYYQEVREILEAELDIINMQFIELEEDTTYIAVTALSIAPATVTLAAAATQQITPTFTPTSPSNTAITYTTSDATKATVSVSGLITAVATGSATITATSVDGAFTDTVVVTIN